MTGSNHPGRRDALALLAALPIALLAGDAVAEPEAGLLVLPDRALAFVPAAAAAPLPVLILLHGAGDDPDELIPSFRTAAERNGFALLAPKSAGPTWDLIRAAVALQGAPPPEGRVRPAVPTPGRDPDRIAAALAALGARCSLDPRRIALAGFSDGASVALSLGPRRPDLYRAVLGFSPGFLFLPPNAPGRQPVFVSHGRQDRILSYAYCSGAIVPELRARGHQVTFRSFDGGHQLLPEVAADAAAFFLAAIGPPRN